MKPKLLNSDMVRAILDGRKTNTRVPIKLPKTYAEAEFGPCDDTLIQWELLKTPENCKDNEYVFYDRLFPTDVNPRCTHPHQVGDVLYLGETLKTGNHPHENFVYVADDEVRYPETADQRAWLWKHTHSQTIPCIHMPKWAARIFLKVTAVSVERVQDITVADCLREGIHRESDDSGAMWYGETETSVCLSKDPFVPFTGLWESIYPGSWERNDFVWKTEFELTEKEVTK